MKFKKIYLVPIIVAVLLISTVSAVAYYYLPYFQPSAKITVKYWTHTYAQMIDLVKAFASEFEVLHPEVNIEIVDTPTTQYEVKLSMGLAGGQGPDCWLMGDWNFPAYQKKGVLAPVDYKAMGYNSQEQYITEKYWPGVTDGLTVNGTCYTGGITEYNTLSVVWNKYCFDKAGVPYPNQTKSMTWNEFAQLAKDLTLYDNNGKMIQMGYGWNFLFYGRFGCSCLEPFLLQNGAQIIDPKTGNPSGLEGWLKAAQYIHDCGVFGEWKFDDPVWQASYDPKAELFNGKCAMILQTSKALITGKATNSSFKGGFFPLPHIEGGPRRTALYSYNLFVNSQSDPKVQEWAWKWIEYMTNDVNTLKWYDKCGFIQPRNVQGYKEYVLSKDATQSVIFDDLQYAEYSFRHVNYNAISEQIPKFGELLLVLGVEPEEAVDTTIRWIKSSASAAS